MKRKKKKKIVKKKSKKEKVRVLSMGERAKILAGPNNEEFKKRLDKMGW